MKTLLAVGCSFTDEKFISKRHPEMDCSWPKWPKLIGEKLGYNVVNLGRCGNSNDSIFKSTQDYIVDHKVDMICSLWTQTTRLNIHDMENFNWAWSFRSKHETELHNPSEAANKLVIFKTSVFKRLLRWKHTVLANEHLRYIYMLDQLGKYNNIPVYHMQGVRVYYPFGVSEKSHELDNYGKIRLAKSEYLNAVLESQYFEILDKQDNIYGWPFYKELGGKSLGDNPIPRFPVEYRISKLDTHPNAKGQQKIASQFMEIIK
tara:strand:- start:464 stop:1246 length:783 start_codon:yes stop_codon:yes gene_type:complete